MTSEFFKHIEQHGACVDLSSRAKWRLSGADAVRYLNGQVTNDVRKAKPDEAIYACVTNAKGKIEGDVFIYSSQSDASFLFIDAEPDLREKLGLRLEKYIVADDVEIYDDTDEWRLWHVPVNLISGTGLNKWGRSRRGHTHVIRVDRFGFPGLDIWQSSDDMPLRFEGSVLSLDDLETWRICRGIPRWPFELNGETFPPEAGLEARAMDFTKGCYIGQEVLSRIKTTGKMPRRLVQFSASSFGEGSPSSWKIYARDVGNSLKEVGAVTSACMHPVLDRCVGLAYVRHNAEVSDSLLLGNGEPTRIFAELKIT